MLPHEHGWVVDGDVHFQGVLPLIQPELVARLGETPNLDVRANFDHGPECSLSARRISIYYVMSVLLLRCHPNSRVWTNALFEEERRYGRRRSKVPP